MSLARNVATVGSATLLSRMLGFARDVMIAAVFGTGIRADAFFVAFQLANLVRRVLAEGALTAAGVPLYLRERDDCGEDAAAAFAGRMIATAAIVLLGAALLLALIMPLVMIALAPGFALGGPRMLIATDLARLMLPYLVIAGPLAVMMGVLNANHRFTAAAFVTAAFNGTMLAALGLIFLSHQGDSPFSGRVLALGVAAGGLAQITLVGIAVWFGSTRIRPLSISFGPQMRRFVALALPALIAGGIPQITVIGGVMVASASRSAVSWIYYANRLIELPLGIIGIAVGTVLVPAFAHAMRSADKSELAYVESRGMELTLGLTLPAAIGLAVLAEPIVSALFQHGAFMPSDTQATAAALSAFALGLPGHVLVKTFSPVFFAREDTATPMRAALFGFAIAIVGSLILMPFLGHVGIALATALSGWASAAMLGVTISRRIGFAIDAEAQRRLPLLVVAALAMGAAIYAARQLLSPWLAQSASATAHLAALVLVLALGLFVYLFLLQVLRVSSAYELIGALRRRA
jgi:putative peptidoglycan lipid II flippase